MEYALLINREVSSKKCSKCFANNYALKTTMIINFGQFYRNRHVAVKLPYGNKITAQLNYKPRACQGIFLK